MNAQTNTKKVYEPIPAGEYLAKAGRFTEKATKAGNGSYVTGTFEIFQGGGFDALGNDVTALEDYVNRACVISVGIKEGTNGYRDSNTISKWATR